MSDYDGGTPASMFSTTDGVIDYTSPAGQVRLLTSDVDQAAPILTDDMITGFLLINGGNVLRAAASALLAIAASEALVSKVIKTQDLQTDGTKLAAELRAQATELRAQADIDDGGFFDVVDTNPYPIGFEAAEIPRQPWPWVF